MKLLKLSCGATIDFRGDCSFHVSVVSHLGVRANTDDGWESIYHMVVRLSTRDRELLTDWLVRLDGQLLSERSL